MYVEAAQYIKKLHPTAILGIGFDITRTQKTFKSIYDLSTMETDGSQFDLLLKEGDSFEIGSIPVKILATPGHTLDSISYVVGEDAVFVGDTLFKEDSGTARCDFPNGNAELLFSSVGLDDEIENQICA